MRYSDQTMKTPLPSANNGDRLLSLMRRLPRPRGPVEAAKDVARDIGEAVKRRRESELK